MLRGRFAEGISPLLLEFSGTVQGDLEFFYEDVWGSQAHVLMLAKQVIISKHDAGKIIECLEDISEEFGAGQFKPDSSLEDIHINIENRVIDECGMDFGGKMHTARSRNDQVLTDTRLHLRQEILGVEEAVLELQNTLLALANKHSADVMPGYTHMQHAQPITFGFWAAAYASMLSRDLERLSNAYKHVNVCPLGACALAGTSFPTDRKYTAKLLGFDDVIPSALDAVSSRDFVAETAAALAILMSNLSKLSEDLVLWSSFEFKFIEFADDFATGSSIMPQKKNPDMAELVRGKTGRVYGALMQILTVMKGLPSGYNRDLQEDREPLWKALGVVKLSVAVMDAGLKGAKINKENMKESLDTDFSTATELANHLVREKKLAFREAYTITGSLVKELVSHKKTFRDVVDVKKILSKSGVEIADWEISDILDPVKSVHRYKSLGSASPKEVKRIAADLLADNKARAGELKKRQSKIEAAKELTMKEIKLLRT
jgi:argininosuccinate lyase